MLLATSNRDPTRPRGRGWPWPWAWGLLALAAVVVIISRTGEAAQFARLLSRSHPAWLALAAGLQIGTYVCTAAVWDNVVREGGYRGRLAPLVRLSLAKLFTDQAIPAGGMSGSLLFVRGLIRRGCPRGVAAAGLFVALLGYYAALAVALAGSIAVLWLARGLSKGIVLLTAAVVLVSAAIVTALVLLFRLAHGRIARPPRWLERSRLLSALFATIGEAPPRLLRDRSLIARAAILQLGVMVLDATTLGAMLAAVRQPFRAGSVLASFVMASAAGMLGPIPGELGTFEAACTLLLHALGTPVEAALTGTLLLRGFTFWLPMIPGMWAARSELGGAPGRPHDAPLT